MQLWAANHAQALGESLKIVESSQSKIAITILYSMDNE